MVVIAMLAFTIYYPGYYCSRKTPEEGAGDMLNRTSTLGDEAEEKGGAIHTPA